MRTDRSVKNALDFDKLKKEKFSLEIDIKVHEEWLAEHPRSYKSPRIIAEARDKISEIDALLAKEPPAPELPPRQPLIKVSGVLEEIETLFARGYFTDREYEPEEFARRENSRQWGSVLLAAIGESAASAVHSQDDVRPVREYDFVKGKINGKPFYGWTGRVTARPGDYVELVAVEKANHYEVYALSIPELRVLSMFPECYQGIISLRISAVKQVFVIYLIIVSMFLFASMFDGVERVIFILRQLPYLMGLAATIFIPLAIWMYYWTLKKPRPTAVMAQRIFSSLEIPNPDRFNLAEHTKKVIKEKREIKGDGRIMPDKHSWVDYYFYY